MNFTKNLYVLTKTQNRFGIVKNPCCCNSEWMNFFTRTTSKASRFTIHTFIALAACSSQRCTHNKWFSSNIPQYFFSDFHKQCFHACFHTFWLFCGNLIQRNWNSEFHLWLHVSLKSTSNNRLILTKLFSLNFFACCVTPFSLVCCTQNKIVHFIPFKVGDCVWCLPSINVSVFSIVFQDIFVDRHSAICYGWRPS